MLIDYDEAVWAVAVQLAFEADMEYSGQHNPEDYLSIAKMYFNKIEAIEGPKRGRWIIEDKYKDYRTERCSVCGFVANRPYIQDVWHYCPNCGARMESE